MASLDDLKRDLERALEGGDRDLVASVRKTLAAAYPDTVEGAEASFKLGLHVLFHERDLEGAAEHLRNATKAKAPTWSQQARVSLGLVLLRQQKVQQAVFELRRAASGKPATILTAQAQGLLVIALRDSGQGKEAEKVRTEQLVVLREVAAKSPPDAPIAHFMLGMEHKHDGERAAAKKHLEAALGSKALSEDQQRQAEQALRDVD